VRTVQAKLLSLGALSVVVMLATLPLLLWLLHTQLVAQISERTANAGRMYQAQLDDDITDVRLAVAVFSSSTTVHQAMAHRDMGALSSMTTAYASLYPDIDIALYDRSGARVTRIGCDEDGPPLGDADFIARTLAAGEAVALSDRGCDRFPMPTYIVGRRIADVGVVVVGLDFSASSLTRIAKKLGVELSLVDREGHVINKTARFPDASNDAFIRQSFAPKQFAETHRDLRLVAALDTTEVKRAIRRTFFEVVGFVVVAAVIAAGVGVRLASRMSKIIRRLSRAFGQLEAQDYAKVEGVTTGDELEDLADAFNKAVDGLHERDKLRSTFGKYMTEAVMEHLLAGKVPLGGEVLTATIVFSDIRSFTSISEKMDAKSLVSLLNEYFTEMVDAITEEQGVVDKYIGDAIMAVYGAPVPKKGDALRAVRSAIAMRKALGRLNERLAARGIAPIRTGIGIHTGEVVAGNIGSERRMEYTVIGDAVNVALRLEAATKELNVPVLISEVTYHLVEDAIDARAVEAVTVKGRAEPVMAYAVEELALRKREPSF
jgi:adenylate cyclase